jgi:uncharacterized protein (TIGR03437 family)
MGLSFTPQQNTWTISGAVTPSTFGAGTTLALSNGVTATADSSGNFTFSGMANGTYVVTPSKAGYTFSPASMSVTINEANQTGIAFSIQGPATLSIDVSQSHDNFTPSSTASSASFSTSSPNELLLAFISTDRSGSTGTTVENLAGGGVTWSLVARTNAQGGDAEIWRAFSPTPLSAVSVTATFSQTVVSSITVMSFIGVDTTGTNGSGAVGATGNGQARSGGPTASLTTTRNNSWVFGVGNDPHTNTARTLGSGQSLVHQFLPSGATFWVQMQTAPTPVAGTHVTINDTAPTSDRYNLTIVEVLPSLSSAGQTMAPMLTSAVPVTQSKGGDLNMAGSASGLTMSNTASSVPGDACTPGGLATLSGSGFTTQIPKSASSLPVPIVLAGVQVAVNRHPAPLVLASATQVNFQCPVLPSGSPLTITLQAEDGSMRSVQSVMETARPGIFNMAIAGQGLITIAATNEIAMPKTKGMASRPAQRGEILSIFATGLGETLDSVPAGSAAPQDRLVPVSNTTKVEIGGVEIDPLFSGLAPGSVGLYQVNAKLPPDVPAGPAVPIVIHVILMDGTVVESNGVTVAISD